MARSIQEVRDIVFALLIVLFLPVLVAGFIASLLYTMLECGWLVFRYKVWEWALDG